MPDSKDEKKKMKIVCFQFASLCLNLKKNPLRNEEEIVFVEIRSFDYCKGR